MKDYVGHGCQRRFPCRVRNQYVKDYLEPMKHLDTRIDILEPTAQHTINMVTNVDIQ